ncbi:probable aquaporin NIP7-1 isoform X2 [Salvia miltiorrhiza]|uniref:probable aquaporin NIP7-1 isoform X2 n=1 Tax=Salvia miltiorrhiza TaxID=226208 RepID=UPI0025ABF4E1|nr:probable aquaporin NIP7-1 isoform X2 [Salvia miltiorrhiza]
MSPTDVSTATQIPDHDHNHDQVYFEILNKHNVIDLSLLRMVAAEAVGTFVLMFCISGIIGNLHSMGIQTGLMEYAATAGLTVVVLVFSIGPISGAHINPAVTIAFAAAGPFPWSKVPLYIAAQVGGSVLATYAGQFVYGIKPEMMLTTPLNNGWINAFLVELVATFIVLFMTTSLFNQLQSIKCVSGFIAGGAICLGVLISGRIDESSKITRTSTCFTDIRQLVGISYSPDARSHRRSRRLSCHTPPRLVVRRHSVAADHPSHP